jgi:hypothetical protein
MGRMLSSGDSKRFFFRRRKAHAAAAGEEKNFKFCLTRSLARPRPRQPGASFTASYNPLKMMRNLFQSEEAESALRTGLKAGEMSRQGRRDMRRKSKKATKNPARRPGF